MDPKMGVLERMVLAVERVRDRLRRAAGALEEAGVPYAVVGGNAVATWVATVDAAAVRNTHIVSQKTIWPTIDGTVRWMPTCFIDAFSPLRSAAVSRPSDWLKAAANLSSTCATI